jgi:hypothetical protein
MGEMALGEMGIHRAKTRFTCIVNCCMDMAYMLHTFFFSFVSNNRIIMFTCAMMEGNRDKKEAHHWFFTIQIYNVHAWFARLNLTQPNLACLEPDTACVLVVEWWWAKVFPGIAWLVIIMLMWIRCNNDLCISLIFHYLLTKSLVIISTLIDIYCLLQGWVSHLPQCQTQGNEFMKVMHGLLAYHEGFILTKMPVLFMFCACCTVSLIFLQYLWFESTLYSAYSQPAAILVSIALRTCASAGGNFACLDNCKMRCNAFCPPADVHVQPQETKMAAGYEYDEYCGKGHEHSIYFHQGWTIW